MERQPELSREEQLKYWDMQLLGGLYKQAHELIKAYPELRQRWSLGELDHLVGCLIMLELEGLTQKGLPYLEEYFEARGDVGDLQHCIDYRTSEYCVMLWLLREKQRKERYAKA